MAVLRESSGYDLYKPSLERPEFIKELADQQAEDISAEIIEVEAKALRLAEEIENLIGREDCIRR